MFLAAELQTWCFLLSSVAGIETADRLFLTTPPHPLPLATLPPPHHFCEILQRQGCSGHILMDMLALPTLVQGI